MTSQKYVRPLKTMYGLYRGYTTSQKIYYPSKTSTTSPKHVVPLKSIYDLSKTRLHYVTFN